MSNHTNTVSVVLFCIFTGLLDKKGATRRAFFRNTNLNMKTLVLRLSLYGQKFSHSSMNQNIKQNRCNIKDSATGDRNNYCFK